MTDTHTENMSEAVETSMAERLAPLHPHALRVLAVLAEKEALTPDNYPLSLNALVNGCNQLSSRDPVMVLSDEDVQRTLQELVDRKLVTEVHQAGARVAKYQHRLRVVWLLEQDKLAVLIVLMLRGSQTAGEIRARSGRLHEFASLVEVETALQFLMDKYPPLVARLVRAPGTKEVRYAHLLSGEVIDSQTDREDLSQGGISLSRSDRMTQLEEELMALKEEVALLKAELQQFREQFE